MQLKVKGTNDYCFLKSMVTASLAMPALAKSFVSDSIKFEDSKH